VPRPPSRLKLVAEAADTLAAFIARRGGVPLAEAQAAVARGGAFLRGRRERSLEAAVRPGDRVEVALRVPEAQALPRECLLHLDPLLLAVDKPAGVIAQEDLAGGPALPELCGALLAQLGEKETQALLVHRLDRGTTGVTVLARTRAAQAALLDEFRGHRAKKEYRALVAGGPAADEGVIDLALGAAERGLRTADPRGEPAITRFSVLERFDGAALIAAFPETGRTHQVRVHLRELGCPLLGDTRYGGPAFLTRKGGARADFARPLLHALSLALRHPAGQPLELKAPVPTDFEQARAFLLSSR
jgi:23S rRNA pseudouridine1911/1915/1917 synthase